MRGKIIVLEGTDGCGKGTQTDLLISYFLERGIDVKKFDFPNYENKDSSEFARAYLNGDYGPAQQIDAKHASLFYAFDRFCSSKEMNSLLDSGKILILNRYVSSNAGHQGGKIRDPKERQKFLDWLYNLEYNLFGIPKPSLQIYLHIPAEIAQELVDKKSTREYIGGKKRDIHEEDKEHLKHAEESYNYLIENESGWEKVECMQGNDLLSIQEIHNKIISLKSIEEIVKEFSNFS